jgi:hypothetical protein
MLFVKKSKHISVDQVLENPYHDWILSQPRLLRFFKHALSQLDQNDLHKLNQERLLCFLLSPGRYASALPSDDKHNFIIIYPELLTLINSVEMAYAEAILFHEMGHIYYKHHKSNKSIIKREIEADMFAIKYGYKKEILNILNNEIETEEIHLRTQWITSLEKSH